MDLNLQNHVAVVTGGSSGIGRAVAEGFAEEGASVALWDIAEETESVADDIARTGTVKTAGCNVDVTDLNAVKFALEKTQEELGPVDHFVHAAAVGSGKFGFPFTNLTPQDWLHVLDVNVMGMVHVADVVSRAMMQRKQGTQIYIASVAGQIGSPTDPPYSASKAANINFAQCLARDLAPFGIRVNTVCPGMVKTPLNRAVWQAWNDRQTEDQKRTYEEWADEKIRDIVPLGRWQKPQDIADMVLFLSSSRAAEVTGQTINVDGGYVMHW
ncbi:MAG: SDR family oxidoreductase [Planctomycetaceae bacterium]